MPEKNDGSQSQLSVRIPKLLHKQAKMLAIARETDLQDVVADALKIYLTYSDTQTSARIGEKAEPK